MRQQLQYERRCFRTTFVVEKLHSEGGVEGDPPLAGQTDADSTVNHQCESQWISTEDP